MQPFADIGSSEIFKCTCNKCKCTFTKFDIIFKCKLFADIGFQKYLNAHLINANAHLIYLI